MLILLISVPMRRPPRALPAVTVTCVDPPPAKRVLARSPCSARASRQSQRCRSSSQTPLSSQALDAPRRTRHPLCPAFLVICMLTAPGSGRARSAMGKPTIKCLMGIAVAASQSGSRIQQRTYRVPREGQHPQPWHESAFAFHSPSKALNAPCTSPMSKEVVLTVAAAVPCPRANCTCPSPRAARPPSSPHYRRQTTTSCHCPSCQTSPSSGLSSWSHHPSSSSSCTGSGRTIG
jgi:hypothetical protein